MKIIGMKKAIGEYRRAQYATMFVDCSTGEVWTHTYIDCNSWTQYHDPMIRRVSDLTFVDAPYTQIAAALSGILDRINNGEITVDQAEAEHTAAWQLREWYR